MSHGWILDVGAVYDEAARLEVVRLLPQVRASGRRVVLPTHVLMELARQEIQARREEAPYIGVDPATVLAPLVVAELKRTLYGVEFTDFTDHDALALLEWLDRPGAAGREWEVKKLSKSTDEGWPPIRDALLALICPSCGLTTGTCPCPRPLWSQRQDKGQLLQAARGHAQRLAQANQARASSTIDWLTAAMARRMNLTIVTRDKRAIEWDGLPYIAVEQLGATIGGTP